MRVLQVGVKAFIRNLHGEYLLIQRAEEGNLKYIWDIPGGRIDIDSDLQTNLEREIIEETNLKIKRPILLCAQDIFRKDLHVVRLTFTADIDCEMQRLIISKEHMDARWLSLDKINELHFLSDYAGCAARLLYDAD